MSRRRFTLIKYYLLYEWERINPLLLGVIIGIVSITYLIDSWSMELLIFPIETFNKADFIKEFVKIKPPPYMRIVFPLQIATVGLLSMIWITSFRSKSIITVSTTYLSKNIIFIMKFFISLTIFYITLLIPIVIDTSLISTKLDPIFINMVSIVPITLHYICLGTFLSIIFKNEVFVFLGIYLLDEFLIRVDSLTNMTFLSGYSVSREILTNLIFSGASNPLSLFFWVILIVSVFLLSYEFFLKMEVGIL